MQNSIKNITGEFTLLGNAEALANGILNPNFLRMTVWKDASGQMWKMTTTNGRTSKSLSWVVEIV